MISVKHLTKCYGEFTAVDDLSFEIDEGHVYGFLGPNGAGKSTTMNIITGCLSATSGQVTIDGHDIFEEPKEAKRAIGYLPEIPPLYTNETPEEYLKFVAEAKGLKERNGLSDRGCHFPNENPECEKTSDFQVVEGVQTESWDCQALSWKFESYYF